MDPGDFFRHTGCLKSEWSSRQPRPEKEKKCARRAGNPVRGRAVASISSPIFARTGGGGEPEEGGGKRGGRAMGLKRK